jgi:CheY-like chemotaxis protein
MDVMMPVMDGYEATRTIRASGHPQAKTVPIIAMTANAYKEDVEMAKQSGMNDHVPKPIDIELLLHVLEHYYRSVKQQSA